MKMTGFEKRFVNRERKGRRNVRKLRERLESLNVERFSDALELGCGIGSVSAFLAERYGMNVEGTDFDPDEIEIARSLHHESDRLRFSVDDATGLSFPGDRFDLVVSQNVFHHLPNWSQVVREVARVLRPDGYFIWLDFCVPATLKKFLRRLCRKYGLYTLDDVRSAFRGNEFEERYEGRVAHGLFPHHEIVAQKIGVDGRSEESQDQFGTVLASSTRESGGPLASRKSDLLMEE